MAAVTAAAINLMPPSVVLRGVPCACWLLSFLFAEHTIGNGRGTHCGGSTTPATTPAPTAPPTAATRCSSTVVDGAVYRVAMPATRGRILT